MGISLAPDQATAPADPTIPPKPKIGLAPGSANLTATGAPATAPLPTEYPSAPSTTGTPQNRLQLATSAFDTFAKSTAPQYTADLREATQKAAGAGNIGSGNLRTTYGNLANQRALALDTERSNLINTATSATIGDQQAADASKIAQQNADTARLGTAGNLDVAKGTLGLETTKAATAANQGQQSIDIQKQNADLSAAISTAGLTGILNGQETLAAKQAAVQQAVSLGSLTVEQGKLALDQLTSAQQIGLATAAQDIQRQVSLGQLSIAQAQQALDEKVKTGALTLDQAKLALDQINSAAANSVNQQNANTNAAGQEASAADAAGRLKLAQDSLAQAGTQFGLSLAQQKDLATLADKTQNRSLDISSAQGQTSLALELARIMGAKDTNALDPNFLQAITKALGLTISNTSNIKSGTQPKEADTPGGTGTGTGPSPGLDGDPTGRSGVSVT